MSDAPVHAEHEQEHEGEFLAAPEILHGSSEDAVRPSSARRSFWTDIKRNWLGLLISAVCLIAVFSLVDFEEFKTALASADYRYIFPAVLVFLAGLLFRTFAWRTLLEERASPRQAFFALNQGYLLNNLLPFRLGEIGRGFLLSRAAQVGFLQVMSTIMIERVFDLLMVVGILAISLAYLVSARAAAGPLTLIVGITMLAGLLVLHLAARNRRRLVTGYAKLRERYRPLRRIAVRQVEMLFQGFAALTDLRRFVLVLLAMGCTWSLIVVHYYLLLLAFEPQGKLLWAAFGIGVVGLSVAVPSAPGSIGVVQGVIVWWFPAVFGVDPAVALAFSLAVHAIYLLITSGLGVLGLLLEGGSLRGLVDNVRLAARKLRGVEGEAM